MSRKVLLLLTVFFITIAFSCELFTPPKAQKSIKALLIALDYSEKPTSGIPINRLNGTLRDAKEVEAALRGLTDRFDQDLEVITLYQEGDDPQSVEQNIYPTKENLLDTLKTSVDTLQKGELLFIYYAGHGEPAPNYGDIVVVGESSETAYERVDHTDILDILSQRREGDILFILDSCYSGTYVPSYSPLGSYYSSHLTVLSASDPLNVSWEEGASRNHSHGFFTRLFLDALGWDHEGGEKETLDGNGVITQVSGSLRPNNEIPTLKSGSIEVGEIYRYIKRRITHQSPMVVEGPTDILLFSAF